MFCKKVRGIVNDLEKEYGEKMAFTQAEAGHTSSQEAIRDNDLGSHGALAVNAEGQVVWTGAGHKLTRAVLLEGVQAALVPAKKAKR